MTTSNTDGLTAAEAGKILGVSGQRVRQMLHSGEIEGRAHADGQYRFDPETIKKLATDRNSGRVRTNRGSGKVSGLTVADLEAVVTRALRDLLPEAIDASIAGLRSDLQKERAARLKVERELAKLQAKHPSK
jgi:hypothetical protein